MPKDTAISCWLAVVVARPTQGPLQRPVIKKQKARGTSWAVIKENTVLSYSSGKKTGHARRPILILSLLRDTFTLRLALRCAASGNLLESSGGYSVVCEPLNN
ncbi:hypothetical protein PoB_003555200 [Plakobranchus ocellatus]|uniref:Secreted protein n=1 Tax=Plakobranchus ocellatus TaxID=259542 RepID=A0AAV4AQ26_9GAST|nr:hypothetical protein PoB_003555200 [Plakobranchus ocellatus]